MNVRRVVRACDRPGGRLLLGALLTATFSVTSRRWYRVRWTGEEWAYRYNGLTTLSDRLMPSARTFDEDLEIFLWDYTPRPGDTILDIGAGTGTEAVRLARSIGPAGRVVAIEAHPVTASILAKTGPLNGLDNITTVECAVADHSGTMQISDDAEAGVNSVFRGGSIDVRCATIDELIEEHSIDRVAFLKMNIEGAERLAVMGMERSADRIDRVAISCHDFLGTEWGATRADVATWLTGHGFALRSRPDDPRPWARDYLYGSAVNRE